MYDFTQVALKSVAIHGIGNKSRAEGFRLAKVPLDVDTEIVQSLMLKFFLSPFKTGATFNSRNTDLLGIVDRIFANPQTLFDRSKEIAELVYNFTEHPKCKAGELYIAYLKDIVLHDEVADAVGIFFSNTKETYFTPPDGAVIHYENGININNLDRACLILNIEKELGYVLAVADNVTSDNWWHELFKTQTRKDGYAYTQEYLRMCAEFAKEVHQTEEKTEITEMQQKVVSFFSNNDEFVLEEFEQEVLVDAEKIEQFREFRGKKAEDREDPSPPHTFDISKEALKSQKRLFKNKIKLDNNFQINVLNANGIIKRGFDEQTGQKYYQLFFDEEK